MEARKISLAKPAPLEDETGIENREWIESLEAVIQAEGPERARELIELIETHAAEKGIPLPPHVNTPYVNTIPRDRQGPYPGDLAIEKRIEALVRWNAMAMVVRANREESGIGGHISTFASCATLYEVGYNHFFHGHDAPEGGDLVYFIGHASPGNYARAYLEGRLDEDQLLNFRREVRSPRGLSSYPHPRLMPQFWEFPTVSMGLGPIQAIYRARFMKYLENRGLKAASSSKVWCFAGDGECDEPETLGSLTLPVREKLDNLVLVVNCNLQRLDGPVRGNGKIIQELEAVFRGIGWNVIKVVWSSRWDPLFERDQSGVLQERLTNLVDGEFLKLYSETGAQVREHLFGKDPKLATLVSGLSDEELDLKRLSVGGHDPAKIYPAFEAAVNHRGAPTVILAHTIKGYGLGEAGEGRNITHQQKKLEDKELRYFRDRLELDIPDEDLNRVPFRRFSDDSAEYRYLQERRRILGGGVPKRVTPPLELKAPAPETFEEFFKGSRRPIATTMALVRQVSLLLRDPSVGKHIVPIVPDEARTFGMESLFSQVGIYSSVGQLYEPVDRANILYYREEKSGQLLEEGITEAGSVSSFIAAGTAHAEHGIPMLPFFFFYSMFGFQRIGDLIWAADDARARGFLVGGTAGRTTLAGEGLQHQDGHSHLLAQPFPHIEAYDPAFAYEIAVIVRDGIRRILQEHEDVIFYLTAGNEPYSQPEMPPGCEEGILKGIYRLPRAGDRKDQADVDLFGSGSLLNECLKARKLLKEEFDVEADVWSVTSYKQLRMDALEVERWNLLHPDQQTRVPFVTSALKEASGSFVAVSDYVKLVPDSISKWVPGRLATLGTDGFGRSDSRSDLRDLFEVDARYVTLAALRLLAERGRIDPSELIRAADTLKIHAEKADPMAA